MQSMTVINKQNEKSPVGKSKSVQKSLYVKTPILHKVDPLEIIQRVHKKPDSITHDDIMVLQNTIGNKAVIKLLSEAQPKAPISKDIPNKLESKEKSEAVQKKSANVVKSDKKAVDTLPALKKTEEKPVEQKEKNIPLLNKQTEAPNKADDIKTPRNIQKEAIKQEENKATESIEVNKQAEVKETTTKVAPMEGVKEPQKQQNVKLQGEDPGKIINQLGNVPPAQIYNALKQAEAVSGTALKNQMNKTQAVIPSIPAPTGLKSGKQQATVKNKVKTIKHEVSENFKSKKSGGKVTNGSLQNFEVRAEANNEADAKDIMKEARAYSSDIPSIGMDGEADPSQIKSFKTEAAQSVKSAKEAELSQINKEFGENQILPTPDNTIIKAKKSVQGVNSPSIAIEHMEGISSEVAARMNPSLAPILKTQLDSGKNKYEKGKEKFDSDVLSAKASTESNIEQMKSETRAKQIGEQTSVKAQVNSYRDEWRNEIKGAVSEYGQQADTASEAKKNEISNVKSEKEGQVHTTMTTAEKDANKEYKVAKTKADDKKKEKEKDKDKGGLLGWVKEKAQQFVEGIKKAVSSIFDGLRKAVKTIFDKAKQAAMKIIEAGRRLIVNIIKGLGDVLKGLVKKVFVKFPGIANKICSKIDQTVNKAIKAVNNAAEKLKKNVSKALDFLSSGVDKLLSGLQSLYNGVFSAIGKFLKQDFKTMFMQALEVAQIAAEIALAFATGGGSVLVQIGTWLGTTLPKIFNTVTSVIGFVDNIRNIKLEDVKQFLSASKIGEFLVKGLFGEVSGLAQGEKEEKKKDEESSSGKESKGLVKILHIISSILNVVKGIYGKVVGGINKILPIINISTKTWFDPFSMIYAGVIKALEVVQNPAEALNEGVEKVKEAIGGFFSNIKGKLTEVTQGIKEKIAIIGQPAQLMKLLANKAVDMVLNFIVTHPPSALIKAVFKTVEAVSGKSIIELVRQYIPFADKLINKIAGSSPVQGLLKPLEKPAKQVGGMIDQVSVGAVGMVNESEQKAVGVFGSGAKLLKGLAGTTGNKKSASLGAGQKKQEGGDFLGVIKSGIHNRLVNLGQKLLKSGKAILKGAVNKVKGFVFGNKLKFKLGNEKHELWIEKQGDKKVVMIASNPKPALEYVRKIAVDSKEDINVKLGKERAIKTIINVEFESDKKLETGQPQEEAKAAITQIVSAGVSKVDFGKHLKDLIGDPPEKMVDPHAHHILFKEGHGSAQKALVKEGQELLRRYNIDPIMGKENLIWAPNRVKGQHGIETLKNVVDNLKSIEDMGGSSERIRKNLVKKLKELGDLAARRR